MTIELTNVSDTYLGTSQTSIIEFLCENSWHFCQKSSIIDTSLGVVYYVAAWYIFSLSLQNVSLKNFFNFFLKTMLWKIFLYIFKKKLFKFSGNWTIICLGKGISRTLEHLELDAYSEPEAYSEHNQASTMERFAKLAIWRTFKPKLKKKKF